MVNRKKALIAGVLGAAGCGLLVLLGTAGVVFVGWNLFQDQAEKALDANPVIRQHVGEIERIEADLVASALAEGVDDFVFRIEGTKGTGVVAAEFVTIDADTEEIRSGTLRLSSGETYELLPLDSPVRGDEPER